MLLAIANQESRFQHRKQVGGPARGLWQFELGGGVAGVMAHRATAGHVSRVLEELLYPRLPGAVYDALSHNDTLACVFARLLLWTLPGALPGPDDPEAGWKQYISGWRPGKPHRGTWDAFYRDAWQRVRIANSGG